MFNASHANDDLSFDQCFHYYILYGKIKDWLAQKIKDGI